MTLTHWVWIRFCDEGRAKVLVVDLMRPLEWAQMNSHFVNTKHGHG